MHKNPGPDYYDISVCHANIRSLKGKDILLNIQCDFAGKYDIITLSETWLSGDDSSGDFQLTGYQSVYQRDRSQGLGGYGGVLAWVANNISCKRRGDLEIADIESMWFDIRTNNNKFLLCVLYKAPNSDDTFWELLQDNLDHVKQTHNIKTMLLGDFNADPTSRQGTLLADLVQVNNLTFHIDKPTRITSHSSTILDQCITNFPTT